MRLGVHHLLKAAIPIFVGFISFVASHPSLSELIAIVACSKCADLDGPTNLVSSLYLIKFPQVEAA